MTKWQCCAGALVALCGGCFDLGSSDDDEDGEDETQSFTIAGDLESNTCGDGKIDAVASLDFEVEVTIDGHDVSWDDGTLVASGDLEDDDVTFEVVETEQVDMREAGSTLPKCVIVRTDTISGALDAATDPTGLDANWRIEYEPTDDSDCSDLLEGSAPDFDALPCSLRYDLAGTVEE